MGGWGGPEGDGGAVGAHEGDLGEGLSGLPLLEVAEFALDVEQVVVVGVVGFEGLEQLGEFLGGGVWVLHEVGVEQVDGCGGLGVLEDVGAGCGGDGGGVEGAGVVAELVEEFVFGGSGDHVVFEVGGVGLVVDFVAGGDEDDLFDAVGVEEQVGGGGVGLAFVLELAFLHGEGVEAGLAGGGGVDVDLACGHVADGAFDAEGVAAWAAGEEEEA